jgi:hypothetical protein
MVKNEIMTYIYKNGPEMGLAIVNARMAISFSLFLSTESLQNLSPLSRKPNRIQVNIKDHRHGRILLDGSLQAGTEADMAVYDHVHTQVVQAPQP